MMTNRVIISFLTTILLLNGCSDKEMIPLSHDNSFEWVTTAVSADTKTTLEGTTLSWLPGDQIGVFVAGHQNNRKFTNTSGDSFKGSFIITDEVEKGASYYAYYPFVQSDTRSTTVHAVLSGEQAAPFDPSANYMVADVIHADYDEMNMPSVCFAFNNQLMSIVKLTVINHTDSYSDQQLIGVEMEATSGETLGGEFAFDVTEPLANPVFSNTPYEITNIIASKYPEENRPLLGSGISHTFYLLVNPVGVSTLQIRVKTTDYTFSFNTSKPTSFSKGVIVSLPVMDVSNVAPKQRMRQCVLWGDSITSLEYRDYVQEQLGPDWEVIRGGVPGDRVFGISGRQGGIPIFLTNSFVIPGSNTEDVNVGLLYSTLNAYYLPGKTQLNLYTDPGSLLNPCTICYSEGGSTVQIVGNLEVKEGSYYFTRSDSGDPITVPEGARLITYGAKAYQNADVIVIYMGANYTYLMTDEVLAAFYQAMIDYTTSKKVIVVGFHMGRIEFTTGGSHTYWTEEYRDVMRGTFGANYLDLKTEGIADALNLLRETGVYAKDQELTAADQEAIDAGYWPASFQQSSYLNNVHLGKYGSCAMSILVKRKMKELGYLNY